MKLKAIIEYIGSDFHGWQIQGDLPTVQGDIENALRIYFKTEAERQGYIIKPNDFFIQGSGRTDAGVHAKGQVGSFTVPDNFTFDLGRLKNSLNALTSKSLLIKSLEVVSDDFDARFSPHYKLYTYKIRLADFRAGIDSNFALFYSNRLDFKLMDAAARLIKGKHDFSSFRASDCGAKSTTRTVLASEIFRRDDCYIYQIVGNGFLKNMVRIIAGSLIAVGQRKISLENFEYSLNTPNSRELLGNTAPAQGLTLEWVKYLDKNYFND